VLTWARLQSKDIDANQFKYFATIAHHMKAEDRVIMVGHEPSWVIDTFEGLENESNLNYLTHVLLKNRVSLKYEIPKVVVG
jgi:hypothetical protein